MTLLRNALNTRSADNNRSSNGFVRAAIIHCAAAEAFLVAALVLLGWRFDIVTFTNLHPNLVAMNPMTAVFFASAGAALLLLAHGRPGSFPTRAGIALAGASALFGVMKLSGYLLGANWVIDQVLFQEKLIAGATPNHMAPNTALCVLLIGAALPLARGLSPWTRRAARLLAVAAIFLALLAVIGYLCGVNKLYDVAGFTGMALHTAFSLVVLSTGALLLATRPQRATEVSRAKALVGLVPADCLIERKVAFGFATSLFIISLIGTASYASLMQFLKASDLNKQTYLVMAAISDFSSSVKDVLMGARGYVISGNPAFLAPYEKSSALVQPQLKELRSLVNDDRRQCVHLQQLEPQVDDCLQIAKRYIDLRRENGFEAARAEVVTGKGKRAMDAIREGLAAMTAEEGRLLTQRSKAEAASIRMTVLVVFMGAATAFVLVGLSGLQILRGMAARTRAESQQRESEARYRFLADTLPQILWTARPDGDVDYFNPRWVEYTGEPLERVRDWQWKDRNIVHPDDQSRILAQWKQAVEQGTSFEGEYRLRRASDGAYRWFLCRGLPRRDEEGRVIQWVGTSTDVDDTKRAVDELERARATAEDANLAKSQFLAHMSHEIRTPLNGVIGTVDLLLDTDLDAQQRRFSLLAKTSAESLTALVSDILDFSKIEDGKLELESVAFSLQLTVEDVIQMLAQCAADKRLELACFIDPAVPVEVCGDPDRLRQVLINLINNAIKFTNHGHVSVRITTDEVAPEHAVIRFSITDSGIGIPADRIDRLFKSFSQLDRSTTRVYGGTGLGLAISKQLATLMGGTIGVESQPGSGSTFWFTVRLDHVAAAPRAAPVKGKGPPLKVLAVDDHNAGREVLVRQLLSWGFEAAAAADAPPALALLTDAAQARAPFHVAIIDDAMPSMSGERLAAEIKSREEIRETVLMILMTMDARIDPETLRRQGFSGHLIKPVRQSQLFDAIQNALAAGCQQADPLGLASPSSQPTARLTAPWGRILIAEDNELNLTVASEILRRYGYSHDAVRNGVEAVEAARSGDYDLILMDCQMPVMDGLEATRQIRKLETEERLPTASGRGVPIIAITANAIKGDREMCLEAGMDEYISKPLHPSELVALIDRFLSAASPVGTSREKLETSFAATTRA